jgi:carboxypeptidase Taq
MPANPSYDALLKALREAATLGSVQQLLNWDQETYMPKAAGPGRAEQQALVAGLVHERRTSPRIGELLAACESDRALTSDPDSPHAANLREIRRDYDRATKLPADLVAEIALATSESQEIWKQAREASDFAKFAPALDRVMGLMRRKAECYGVPKAPDGTRGELYDALLDEYEPDMTARQIEAIFTPLRSQLTDLVKAVKATKAKVSTKCLEAKIDPAAQHAFGLYVLRHIGFDLEAGRLDTTTHPFCSGFAPGDTRLTTRYRDEKFTDALFGTLHEAGHGMYEQGLPKSGPLFGSPLADAVSLGVHESQSRMWENFVGRSKPFWKWALPKSKKFFGKSLSKYDEKHFFAACNTVQPSLIRVEADEGTYNMHVMVRFEIERAFFAGSTKTKDIPALWNEKYKEYLGIKVPDDRRGCLQDVHWSFGLVGYFPTYTLGNLLAAQLWEAINEKVPNLSKQIAKGNFADLKAWLNSNIHAHGRRYSSARLCELATGKPLTAEPLMRHLTKKAQQVYGI